MDILSIPALSHSFSNYLSQFESGNSLPLQFKKTQSANSNEIIFWPYASLNNPKILTANFQMRKSWGNICKV